MFKDLKKGLIIGFGIMLMVGISGIAYSALSSLTASDSETLTAAKWNALVEHAVPTGFVGSFYLATCPTGWSEANGIAHTLDLRGTFIRGMNGDANSRDVVRTLGDYQIDDFKSHLHSQGVTAPSHNVPQATYNGRGYSRKTSNTGTTGGTETRPKNVALLYCVKD